MGLGLKGAILQAMQKFQSLVGQLSLLFSLTFVVVADRKASNGSRYSNSQRQGIS